MGLLNPWESSVSLHSVSLPFSMSVTYKTPQTCKAPLTPEASLPLATALNSASPDKPQNSTMNDNSGAAANVDEGELGSDAEGQIKKAWNRSPLLSMAVWYFRLFEGLSFLTSHLIKPNVYFFVILDACSNSAKIVTWGDFVTNRSVFFNCFPIFVIVPIRWLFFFFVNWFSR